MRLPTDFIRSGYTRMRAYIRRDAPLKTSAETPPPESQNGDSAQFAQARALHQQGQLNEAEVIYRTLLQNYPKDFDLLHLLGMVQGQRNNFADAAALIEQAIAIDPGSAAAHSSLGNCLKGLGKYEEALASYDRALALRPNDADTWSNRGATLRDLKHPEQALESYDRALAINPNHVLALDNRGTTLRDLQRPEEALASHDRALAINTDYGPAHYNLALLLMAQDKLYEAIEHFSKALRYKPDHRAAQSLMLHLMQRTCRWDDFDSNIESLRHGIFTTASSAESIVSPSIFMALPHTMPDEQKLCAEKWVQFEYQSLAALRDKLAFDHRRPRNKKINVGYLSRDFREHAVARLMAQVFELHNRDHFCITAYSYGPDDSGEMRRRLQKAFDEFVDIRTVTDADAARQIYANKVDILVDLSGFTDKSRSTILALRPAPRQLSYLGYLGTMGADFVDYLIADHFIVPPEHQNYYTERILYLPNCFQPNDSTRPRPPAPSRNYCSLPESAFIFCSFNQTYKITPEVFDIWCRLLIAVPGSVLWLVASTSNSEANLKHEAEIRGVNPLRLVMAPMVRTEEYLARMQCADLYLDTIPYNAGTTCSDALWMGLPVVTCVGRTFSSRMAGSLLSAIELPELITYNLEDYYRLALELATDRNKLAAIRSKLIANRDSTPLFDSARFTRDLEGVYFTLMNNAKSGLRHAAAN